MKCETFLNSLSKDTDLSCYWCVCLRFRMSLISWINYFLELSVGGRKEGSVLINTMVIALRNYVEWEDEGLTSEYLDNWHSSHVVLDHRPCPQPVWPFIWLACANRDTFSWRNWGRILTKGTRPPCTNTPDKVSWNGKQPCTWSVSRCTLKYFMYCSRWSWYPWWVTTKFPGGHITG